MTGPSTSPEDSGQEGRGAGLTENERWEDIRRWAACFRGTPAEETWAFIFAELDRFRALASLSPTPQDGEGLADEVLVERAAQAVLATPTAINPSALRHVLRIALAAVAPDIAAAARRECAEELRAELDRISERSRLRNPKMRDLEHVSYIARLVVAGQLGVLADRWSGHPATTI